MGSSSSSSTSYYYCAPLVKYRTEHDPVIQDDGSSEAEAALASMQWEPKTGSKSKKILVLGKEGQGKSSLLRCLGADIRVPTTTRFVRKRKIRIVNETYTAYDTPGDFSVVSVRDFLKARRVERLSAIFVVWNVEEPLSFVPALQDFAREMPISITEEVVFVATHAHGKDILLLREIAEKHKFRPFVLWDSETPLKGQERQLRSAMSQIHRFLFAVYDNMIIEQIHKDAVELRNKHQRIDQYVEKIERPGEVISMVRSKRVYDRTYDECFRAAREKKVARRLEANSSHFALTSKISARNAHRVAEMLPLEIVVCVGRTQQGKSSLVKVVTGKSDVEVGNGIESCTREISMYEGRIHGRKCYIVDTIGTDDTAGELSDKQIYSRISDEIKALCKQHTVTAFLIFQRIEQPIKTSGDVLQLCRAFLTPDLHKSAVLVITAANSVSEERRAQYANSAQKVIGNFVFWDSVSRLPNQEEALDQALQRARRFGQADIEKAEQRIARKMAKIKRESVITMKHTESKIENVTVPMVVKITTHHSGIFADSDSENEFVINTTRQVNVEANFETQKDKYTEKELRELAIGEL